MNQVWGKLEGFKCAKFNMIKDGSNNKNKGSVYVLGNTNLK